MMDTIIASFVGTFLALVVFTVPASIVVKRKLKDFNPLGGFNQ